MTKNLSILDLDKALSIVSGNRKLADDLLAMLIKASPDYMQEIKKQAVNNKVELKNIIHKTHGGLRYIGAPALSEIIATTNINLFEYSDKQLKQQTESILEEFQRLIEKGHYPEK